MNETVAEFWSSSQQLSSDIQATGFMPFGCKIRLVTILLLTCTRLVGILDKTTITVITSLIMHDKISHVNSIAVNLPRGSYVDFVHRVQKKEASCSVSCKWLTNFYQIWRVSLAMNV